MVYCSPRSIILTLWLHRALCLPLLFVQKSQQNGKLKTGATRCCFAPNGAVLLMLGRAWEEEIFAIRFSRLLIRLPSGSLCYFRPSMTRKTGCEMASMGAYLVHHRYFFDCIFQTCVLPFSCPFEDNRNFTRFRQC